LQQQLLKDGCYLIDLPNSDPNDLALGAKVKASSFSPPVPISARAGQKPHPLGCNRAVMFKVAQPEIKKIALYLESSGAKPIEAKLTLRKAAQLGDYSSTKDLATARAAVPPNSKGWVEFAVNASVQPGYYYIFLPKTSQLSWWLFDVQPPDTSRAFASGAAWNVMPDCYRFRLDPPSESEGAVAAKRPDHRLEAMFAPENVVNGFARAIRAWPNSWRPERGKPLPQWIELDFGREAAFNCVHVAFQTRELRADAFRLEVPHGDGWQAIAEKKDNLQRRCVIRFDSAKAARLRLVVTRAEPDMGICEIRVYNER
jgi:hypothetical protein